MPQVMFMFNIDDFIAIETFDVETRTQGFHGNLTITP